MILSWNCRGLGQPPTVLYLQDLICKNCPPIVFLMETKQPKQAMELIRKKMRYTNAFYVDPIGASGGLALWWFGDIDITILRATKNFIDVEWKESRNLFVTFTYGAPVQSERLEVWNQILSFSRDINEPWCLVGDFNALLSREDKEGMHPPNAVSMRNFRSFVFDAHLMDIPSEGPRFTWSNNNQRGNLIKQKLDRGFCNLLWSELFPKATVSVKSRYGSDHSPIILLSELDRNRTRRRFFYEAGWIEKEAYVDTINQGWQTGQPSSINLKRCAENLTHWKHETLGRNKHRINQLLDSLNHLNLQPTSLSNTDEEIRIRREVSQLWQDEETYWAQRAHINWLKLGDRNTRFFHNSTIQRRRRNQITSIKDERGLWIDDPGELNSHIKNFFHSLFSGTKNVTDLSFLQDFPKLVTTTINSNLCRAVSFNEVKSAVFQLGPLKSPGPDGFPGKFFQHHWDKIGTDLFKEIEGFFNTAIFPRSWNDTNIVLIPKLHHPEFISQYRPISITNFRAKIISKILSSRLKPYMPMLISELQSAFTGTRAIQDNVIIAHEVIHKLKTRKLGRNYDFLLKVDMMKAFDRVSWEFLLSTLSAMGFSQIWIAWIESIITSVRFSVLVNGNATQLFSPTRGLRQGDPLSPFLFIIVSNVLSFLIKKDLEYGLLKGIKLNHRCPTLSHILFADDTLIFGKANAREAAQIKLIFQRYSYISGQAINEGKSALLFSKNTPPTVKDEISAILNVSHQIQFGKYLGMPAEWGSSKVDTFAFILERLHIKAQSWTSLLLSHGGRETLSKSVLQAIPSYIFSCFMLPDKLLNKMDALIRRYWWSGDPKRRAIHWCAANKLTSAKGVGGLGFRSFKEFNEAFLAKVGWNIIHQPNSLWVRLLKALYFPRHDFVTAPKHHRPSWIWSSILKGRASLLKGLRRNIGNGNDTLTTDPWLPDLPGFTASPSSICSISSCISQPQNVWNVTKLSTLFPQDVVRQILAIPIGPNRMEDRWIWHFNPRGTFSVKSCYHTLKSNGLSPTIARKEWKWLWRMNLPPNIKFFLWRVCNNALANLTNLASRNCSPTVSCPCCRSEPESLFHLFFSCDSTADQQIALKVSACLWTIWKARNEVVFRNSSSSLNSLKHKVSSCIADFSCSQASSHPPGTNHHSQLSINQPPNSEHRTLLCDGSYLGTTQKAGYCAVLFSTNGNAIEGKAGSFLCRTP
ncbi:LINE-1 retrotransposable element ORF2 protein, partial [Linum perenne]